MDPALRVEQRRELTTRFYSNYLNFPHDGREHISVLFYDRPLPRWFGEGLEAIQGTRWIYVDANKIASQREVLEALWAPGKRYLSVHDYVVDTFFPGFQTAVRFTEVGHDVDYTSFEFPRFDVTQDQMEELLWRYVRGDCRDQLQRADVFYQILGNDPGYEVVVRSGPNRTQTLVVRGPEPWMELVGPLCEGNVRFAPGAELFYHGRQVSGTLHCNAGINLLPLRSPDPEVELCRALLDAAQVLRDDPIDLEIRGGRVVAIRSVGPAARRFKDLFATDEAFSHVVEVGLGLSVTAGPLEYTWAATSNEAVAGIHLGIGADPADTARFNTQVHLDFVCPDASIEVNGKLYYDGRLFC